VLPREWIQQQFGIDPTEAPDEPEPEEPAEPPEPPEVPREQAAADPVDQADADLARAVNETYAAVLAALGL